jgi:hypothetical protein
MVEFCNWLQCLTLSALRVHIDDLISQLKKSIVWIEYYVEMGKAFAVNHKKRIER